MAILLIVNEHNGEYEDCEIITHRYRANDHINEDVLLKLENLSEKYKDSCVSNHITCDLKHSINNDVVDNIVRVIQEPRYVYHIEHKKNVPYLSWVKFTGERDRFIENYNNYIANAKDKNKLTLREYIIFNAEYFRICGFDIGGHTTQETLHNPDYSFLEDCLEQHCSSIHIKNGVNNVNISKIIQIDIQEKTNI